VCFSARASFIAAGALGAIGSATVAQCREKKSLPFAMTPLFFGLQQLCEGIVWLGLSAAEPLTPLHTIAVYLFCGFALMFWPIWLPWSLYLIETRASRKRVLFWFVCFGAVMGILSFAAALYFGITASEHVRHITYQLTCISAHKQSSPWLYLFTALYAIPTVISFFVSTIPFTSTIGLIAAAALIFVQISYHMAFASVWCFFAALISICFYGIQSGIFGKLYKKEGRR